MASANKTDGGGTSKKWDGDPPAMTPAQIKTAMVELRAQVDQLSRANADIVCSRARRLPRCSSTATSTSGPSPPAARGKRQ